MPEPRRGHTTDVKGSKGNTNIGDSAAAFSVAPWPAGNARISKSKGALTGLFQ